MFRVGVLRIVGGGFVLGSCSELHQVLLLNCEIFQRQFLIRSLRSSHCILIGFLNLDLFCIFLCFFFYTLKLFAVVFR